MSGAHASLQRAGGAIFVALVVVAAMTSAACDETGSSTVNTPGNTVVNDTRDAEIRAPANPDPGDGAPPVGQPEASDGLDGGYPSDAPTASYPGATECSSCSCPQTTSYCFGGATPRKHAGRLGPESASDAAAGDGAAPPCPMVTAGAVGCAPLPAGATDCPSLLATLQPTYSCYLVCASSGTQITAYCPNP